VVSVVLCGIVRVLVVEGWVSWRPVHHLLSVHHVSHGTVGTVRSARSCVRRKDCSIRLVDHRLNYSPPGVDEPVVDL
jgi:hypothetical protein